jgi:DNA-binding Lrp family transcriptional regulator
VDLPLTGREESYKWLRERERDSLLVGSPGSGKTALLAALVAEGLGSFMVSTDMTAVANAIRQQGPAVVIVDDLDDTVAACRDLVRLRAEIGADFWIVVTDWEANPELQQVLGLGDADVLTLDLLTRDEIVDVVRAVGVGGPNELVREIVNQSEGVPGLAVTLTQAAAAGDYQELFEGNRLGMLMESTVNRLLGNPGDGDRAVLALGSVALAGDSGLTLEEIAEFVGASKSEVQGLLRRLTSGGVIRSDSRRVTLRPRALRRYMIRKAFFGPGAADYTSLMSVVPNPGETATELVLAARAGAVVPGLLDIVLASGDTMAARYLVGSGTRQARDFLEAAPEMAIHVATEALHTAPEVVLPMLLALAVGDSRELHNTPEQPLRLIKDWANSGVPGSGDAVSRKRVVVTAALRWAAEGNDLATACRACAEVMRTTFEGSETDPGQGRTFSLFRGMLTEDEIEQLRPLWDEVRAAIGEREQLPWPSLISMCWELIHPGVFGDPPADAYEPSRRFGELVLADLGDLAAEHPGVLDRLNTLREHLGHDEFYAIPQDYETLLGDRGHSDWRREEEERTRQINELAPKPGLQEIRMSLPRACAGFGRRQSSLVGPGTIGLPSYAVSWLRRSLNLGVGWRAWLRLAQRQNACCPSLSERSSRNRRGWKASCCLFWMSRR